MRIGPQQDYVLIKHMYEAQVLNDVPTTAYHMAVTESLAIWDPYDFSETS